MLLYECLQILTRQLWMRRQVRVGASLLGCMAVELCHTVTYLHRAAELWSAMSQHFTLHPCQKTLRNPGAINEAMPRWVAAGGSQCTLCELTSLFVITMQASRHSSHCVQPLIQICTSSTTTQLFPHSEPHTRFHNTIYIVSQYICMCNTLLKELSTKFCKDPLNKVFREWLALSFQQGKCPAISEYCKNFRKIRWQFDQLSVSVM